MRKSKRLFASTRPRAAGSAFARFVLGGLGALVLLAAPFCVAQAQNAECETMAMAMPLNDVEQDGSHDDKSMPVSKPDCAVGCRIVPGTTAQVVEPVRVSYDIRFETEPRRLVGIVTDPAVPPPR